MKGVDEVFAARHVADSASKCASPWKEVDVMQMGDGILIPNSSV
jgi:hypothetical protein